MDSRPLVSAASGGQSRPYTAMVAEAWKIVAAQTPRLPGIQSAKGDTCALVFYVVIRSLLTSPRRIVPLVMSVDRGSGA
jgi:hypothetical protein